MSAEERSCVHPSCRRMLDLDGSASPNGMCSICTKFSHEPRKRICWGSCNEWKGDADFLVTTTCGAVHYLNKCGKCRDNQAQIKPTKAETVIGSDEQVIVSNSLGEPVAKRKHDSHEMSAAAPPRKRTRQRAFEKLLINKPKENTNSKNPTLIMRFTPNLPETLLDQPKLGDKLQGISLSNRNRNNNKSRRGRKTHVMVSRATSCALVASQDQKQSEPALPPSNDELNEKPGETPIDTPQMADNLAFPADDETTTVFEPLIT